MGVRPGVFMNQFFLFLTATLIWGSTWLAIKFQLGEVPALVSVVYRFVIASAILFGFMAFKRLSFRFSAKQHAQMALLGCFLFGLNYWAIYHAETLITSALAAVVSTSIVYFNVFFGRLIFKIPLKVPVIIGGGFGMLGVIMIFLPEINIAQQQDVLFGAGLSLLGCLMASMGNLIAGESYKDGIPVVQANAFGMGYAAILITLVCLIQSLPFTIEPTVSYLGSLFYLALFGSVLAFGAYLTLVKQIGADKASYVVLMYPAVALALSVWFEGYHWGWSATLGLALIVFGKLVAMEKVRWLIPSRHLSNAN